MYTDRIPSFDIDLDVDEYYRWQEVIEADRETVMRLAEEASNDYAHLSGIVKWGLRTILSIGYKTSGGRYQNELRAWADALGQSFGNAVLMNCAYEMSHIANAGSAFGCTAGVRWIPKLGMVHVRTLDWPLWRIGQATRIFKFRKGKRRFTAVGISGYVGVLSGILPGAYSATINWAPPDGRPKFDFGPAFLLREVLETCDTYEEATGTLINTTLSTPVFFTVCGVKRGQACVIERTHKDAVVRKFRSPVLVQGNHHVAGEFVCNNTDKDICSSSKQRVKILGKRLHATQAHDLKSMATCMDVEPVSNEDTVQKMAFFPKTGKVHVWRMIEPY